MVNLRNGENVNQLEGIEGDGRDEIEAIETDNKELDVNKSLIETREGRGQKMKFVLEWEKNPH